MILRHLQSTARFSRACKIASRNRKIALIQTSSPRFIQPSILLSTSTNPPNHTFKQFSSSRIGFNHIQRRQFSVLDWLGQAKQFIPFLRNKNPAGPDPQNEHNENNNGDQNEQFDDQNQPQSDDDGGNNQNNQNTDSGPELQTKPFKVYKDDRESNRVSQTEFAIRMKSFSWVMVKKHYKRIFYIFYKAYIEDNLQFLILLLLFLIV